MGKPGEPIFGEPKYSGISNRNPNDYVSSRLSNPIRSRAADGSSSSSISSRGAWPGGDGGATPRSRPAAQATSRQAAGLAPEAAAALAVAAAVAVAAVNPTVWKTAAHLGRRLWKKWLDATEQAVATVQQVIPPPATEGGNDGPHDDAPRRPFGRDS